MKPDRDRPHFLQRLGDRIPQPFWQGIAWLRWLFPVLFVLMVLYAALSLLQMAGLIPSLLQETHPLALELKPIPRGTYSDINLMGKAPPYSHVEVGVNERFTDDWWCGSDGIFSLVLQLPRETQRVWARARDSQTGKIILQDSIPFQWKETARFDPTLETAIFVPELQKLWVAGRAIPGASLELTGENDSHFSGRVFADDIGVYDAFLPIEQQPAGPIRVRMQVRDTRLVSNPLAVTQMSLAELPLNRQTEVHLNADKPSIHLHIELPQTHPYIVALSQGLLSQEDFVLATLGRLTSFQDIAFTRTLTIQDGLAKVDLSGQWPWPLAEFDFSPAGLRGMNSFSLLTPQDAVTIHFENIGPEWFGGNMPTQLEAGRAIWRAPSEGGGSRQAIQVGLSLPPGVVAGRASQAGSATAQEDPGELKYREWVADIEAATGNFVSQSWRTLILLIPYIGMLWFSRIAQAHQFGDRRTWKVISTAVIVLAIWRNWNYLYFLSRGPAIWLQSSVTPIRYALRIYSSGSGDQRFWDATSHTFWLMFAGLLALAPWYLPVVERRLDWRPAYARGEWLPLKGKRLGLRIVYGLLILLPFTAVFLWFQNSDFLAKERLLEQISLRFPSEWGDISNSDLLFVMSNDHLFAVVLVFLLALFLLTFGWRPFLFGIGLLAVTLRAAAQSYPDYPAFEIIDPFIAAIRWVPWEVILAFMALAAYPLVARSLRRLEPRAEHYAPRWPSSRLTLAFIAAAMLLPHLPPRWTLVLGGILIFSGIGWLMVSGLSEFELVKSRINNIGRWKWLFVAGLAAASLIFVWPVQSEGAGLRFRDLFSLVAILDGVFIYYLAAILILLLFEYSRAILKGKVILDPPLLILGVFLFSVFLINSSTRWLFIPVPFLVGLVLAHYLLLQPHGEELAKSLKNAASLRKKWIQDILDASSAQGRLGAIKKALTKKLEGGDLTPEEYEKKLGGFKSYYSAELNLEMARGGQESKDVVFAVGDPDLWENTKTFVKVGALLAIVPLLIALYEYLPSSQVNYPYPVADLITFLIRASASWLLCAFFFGYFYVHIRGTSGLWKGFYLFLCLVTPFAAYRFLSTESLAVMRPFLIWATQIFLFCTLLGLLAVDYRVLRKNGFALRDLIAVHNLPVLSAYASTVIAALAPSAISLLTGRVDDVVKFFLETILPQMPKGGP